VRTAAAALVLAAAVALAALLIAGRDAAQRSSDARSAQDMRRAQVRLDRRSRADADELAAFVLRCYRVGIRDFTGCDIPGKLEFSLGELPRVSFGEDLGESEIVETTRRSFVVAARSGTGNRFEVRGGPEGVSRRRCERPGFAGCPRGGAW
jgi:hypothetical protein